MAIQSLQKIPLRNLCSVHFCKSTTLSVYSSAMETVMLLLAMKALNVSL